MNMLISVITVCFNSADTIRGTLRFVVDQTHPEVEHAIVDGGSRDDTAKLAHTFGFNGKISISEPGKGFQDVMDKGLPLAPEDVIGPRNADNMYVADAVLAKVGAIMQKGGLKAFYGDTEFVHPTYLRKPVATVST